MPGDVGEGVGTASTQKDSASAFPGQCCAYPLVRFSKKLPKPVAGIDCESPLVLACLSCGASGAIRCDTSQSRRCEPCAKRSRRRVQQLVQDGLEHVPPGTALLLTVTAPSDRGSHCRRHRRCEGTGSDCEMCTCSPPGGVDLAEWNASCTKRMNRVLEGIRRGEASPLVGGVRCRVRIEYFQGREVQERGALHFHVVLISPTGRSIQLDRRALRGLVMVHGFGHEIDLQRIGTSKHGGSKAKSPGRVAWYVSKYVSKSADARDAVPWASPRVQRQAPYRTWTRSRGWPRTMKEVRNAQRKWAHEAAAGRRS